MERAKILYEIAKKYAQKIIKWIWPPLNFNDNTVCWDVTRFIFDVLSSMRGLLTEYVHMPLTANEIYTPSGFLTYYYGVPMLQLRLLKRKELNNDDCTFLRVAIQSTLNARILDGYLIGCNWAIVSSSNVPLLKVANVEQSGIFIMLGIILTNDKESAEAARKSDIPTTAFKADDTDPLF